MAPKNSNVFAPDSPDFFVNQIFQIGLDSPLPESSGTFCQSLVLKSLAQVYLGGFLGTLLFSRISGWPNPSWNIPSLKLTFSPLKMDGWKMNFPMGICYFQGG